jgi:hypothetical protein
MINTEKSEIYNKLGCDAAAKGNGTFCSSEKIREPKTAEKTRLEQRSLYEEELVYSKLACKLKNSPLICAAHKSKNSEICCSYTAGLYYCAWIKSTGLGA